MIQDGRSVHIFAQGAAAGRLRYIGHTQAHGGGVRAHGQSAKGVRRRVLATSSSQKLKSTIDWSFNRK